jgi:hypothetical protein
MKWIVTILFLIALTINPAMADEVSVQNFELKTTKDLISLCTASPDDPFYSQAIHYCHGYLLGAYHYYQASTAGPKTQIRSCVLPKNDHPGTKPSGYSWNGLKPVRNIGTNCRSKQNSAF